MKLDQTITNQEISGGNFGDFTVCPLQLVRQKLIVFDGNDFSSALDQWLCERATPCTDLDYEISLRY